VPSAEAGLEWGWSVPYNPRRLARRGRLWLLVGKYTHIPDAQQSLLYTCTLTVLSFYVEDY
jgi:hypothetical protein